MSESRLVVATPYSQIRPGTGTEVHDYRCGQKAARDYGVKDDLDGAWEIRFGQTYYTWAEFMSGFASPLLRDGRLPKDVAKQFDVWEDGRRVSVDQWIRIEENKLAKKAVKAAKAKTRRKGPKWMVPARLMMPDVGTRLLLEEDWVFALWNESRNTAMCEVVGMPMRESYREDLSSKPVTLFQGSQLTVDRVYIRKGANTYSSVTFWWTAGRVCLDGSPTVEKPKTKVRFWVKLADVNAMVCAMDEWTLPGGEV